MAVSTFDDARAAVRTGTSPEDAARALVATMTEDERLWCLDGDAPTWAGATYLTSQDGYHKAPFLAAVVDRVGLPGIAFSDGPRGAVIGNATCFPVSMARGATWDPELEERVGLAIGRELRALGANLTGAVCVNVLRHPAWGRAQETYGEDPFHVGEHGAALTRGLQQHVMASAKHFACNSMENARFTVDIEVDEVALHEVYLPHFRRIVDEGVASIMSAYNSVNGEWCGHSRPLLTDVLRDEWGFQGFVISDWVFGMRDAAASLHGGLDIEMPWRMIRAQHLRAALDGGEASWDEVDTAVAHTVATLLRFDDVLSADPPPASVIGSAEHRALAREVAGRSVVLLRNQEVDGAPMLPMAADARVAVLGRLADTVNLGDAVSSDVWDLECRTVLDGLRDSVADVVHDDGSDVERAAAVAAEADVAVVVVGYTYLDEGEYLGEMDASMYERFPPGDEPDVVDLFQSTLVDLPSTEKPGRLVDRPPTGFGLGGDKVSLRLPDADVSLIHAVAAANPRTVVAMQTGSAVVVSDWIDEVPAVVYAWYGGCEAGPGLADVLLGTVNPSARLPFSVPVDEGDLPAFDRDAKTFVYDRWHGWWHFEREGRAPQFPFGFGLTYTDFAIGSVDVSVADGGVEVRATVTNTGARDGADVVQVYAALPDPAAPPRLVGFGRVEVLAGTAAEVAITVPRSRFETRDPDAHRWLPASGPHRITVGRHAGDPAATTVAIDL
jgi:beta-glucosidase